MNLFFAHEGQVHETATESITHSALTEWYIIIPLFILILLGLGTLTYFLSRRSQVATFSVVMLAILITGLSSYQMSPALSIMCLAVGFAVTLAGVVSGLSKKS